MPAASRRPKISPDERRIVMDSLGLRRADGALRRFALMQALAVLIAAMGLQADSAAVVIGAMLIAPLMGPIMAFAASVCMGWGNLALRSLALIVAASVGSVALAFVAAAAVPGPALGSEILSRTAPGFGDLVVALAAGIAGSYATVRSHVSSSLPGVAVAVALVPPLAAVGLSLEADEPQLAIGALLLFLTNLAAIVLAGLVVFPLSGLVPSRLWRRSARRFALVMATTVVITGGLGLVLAGRTVDAARSAEELADARRLVSAWSTGAGLTLENLTITDDDGRRIVTAAVSGSQPPEVPGTVVGELREMLGDDTGLVLEWVRRSTASTGVALGSVIDPDVARNVVRRWLAVEGVDSSAHMIELEVLDDRIEVAVTGGEPPRSADLLERMFAEQFGMIVPIGLTAQLLDQGGQTDPDGDVAADVISMWAAERGLVVAELAWSDDQALVTFESPVPPVETRTLRDGIRARIGRPVDLVARHRTVTSAPLDQGFAWPVDCGPAEVTVSTRARPGFTTGPAGEWLETLLDQVGVDPADDGSSFVVFHADGVLSFWSQPAATTTAVADGRSVLPADLRRGPRGIEIRTGTIDGSQLWMVALPAWPTGPPGQRCLPSTTELDRLFARLVTAAGGSDVPATPGSPGSAVSPGTPTDWSSPPDPAAAVLAAAAADGLPLALTADGSLVIGTGDERARLVIDILADRTVRSGGLGLSVTPATDPAVILMLERLRSSLAARPFLGVPSGP